jgi:hypothetical protein
MVKMDEWELLATKLENYITKDGCKMKIKVW